MRILTLIFMVLFVALSAYAVGSPEANSYLIDLAIKYPWFGKMIVVVFYCRLYVKPTVTYIQKMVAQSETKWDDSLLDKIQDNKAFKVLAFLADWIFSLKVESVKKVQRRHKADKKIT